MKNKTWFRNIAGSIACLAVGAALGFIMPKIDLGVVLMGMVAIWLSVVAGSRSVIAHRDIFNRT